MSNKENEEGVNSLPDYFNLEKELQFLYSDKRRFSRAEALPVVAWKILGFKNKVLTKDFLKSILKYQAIRFNFIDSERPVDSLVDFFTDLKFSFRKASVLENPNHEYAYWKMEMGEYFIGLHNSLFKIQKGHYFIPTGYKADEEAEEFLNIIYKVDGIDPKSTVPNVLRQKETTTLLAIPQVAKILNCTRETVYKVHLKKGLKTVKPTGTHQKIRSTDLQDYMEQM